MDTIFLNYRILKLDDLFDYELGKFMFQYTKKNLPNSFNNYFPVIAHQRTRAATRGDFYVPRFNKQVGLNSIKYQGPKLWNKLSSELKKASINKFKVEFKNWIFANF